MSGLPRLHWVTDDDVLADPQFPDTAEAVLGVCGPAAALHLRGPATTGAALHRLAVRVQAAALHTGALLLVNDRVDIAMAVRANGVQLGARSMTATDARALLGAGALIGCSVHSAGEARDAAADGADFVIAGTIFASASHPDRVAAGLPLLAETAARATVPVIAIGGMSVVRVADAAAAGAAGVAVLGGVWRAADPCAAAAAYLEQARANWQEAS